MSKHRATKESLENAHWKAKVEREMYKLSFDQLIGFDKNLYPICVECLIEMFTFSTGELTFTIFEIHFFISAHSKHCLSITWLQAKSRNATFYATKPSNVQQRPTLFASIHRLFIAKEHKNQCRWKTLKDVNESNDKTNEYKIRQLHKMLSPKTSGKHDSCSAYISHSMAVSISAKQTQIRIQIRIDD